MRKILRKHLFVKTCSRYINFDDVFQVSHPYSSTLDLNIRILVVLEYLTEFQTSLVGQRYGIPCYWILDQFRNPHFKILSANIFWQGRWIWPTLQFGHFWNLRERNTKWCRYIDFFKLVTNKWIIKRLCQINPLFSYQNGIFELLGVELKCFVVL